MMLLHPPQITTQRNSLRDGNCVIQLLSAQIFGRVGGFACLHNFFSVKYGVRSTLFPPAKLLCNNAHYEKRCIDTI